VAGGRPSHGVAAWERLGTLTATVRGHDPATRSTSANPWARSEAGTHRVALRVALHSQEVVALLDGEGAEAALAVVTAAVVVLVVAPDVGGQEPPQVFAQVAIGARSEDQVEMVGQ
jgi:hypothetical protein